jgi:acyl-[acyl-carrier-protein]-phospholipid O-acyltransferase/long-chain-fatty-acid--[acyl-carrier-protein] ligase
VAVACWVASLFIPSAGGKAKNLRIDPNIFASTKHLLVDLRRDSRLWTGTLVANWFWAFGAVVVSLLPTLAARRFGGDENLYVALLALFSVAVAFGSAAAAWLARGRILLLPTPAAAVLMSLFALDLGVLALGAPAQTHQTAASFLTSGRGLRAAADFFGIAAGGGLFVVPVFAAVQSWAGEDRRARTIAAGNVVSAAYMVGAAAIAGALQAFGMPEGGVLILLGLCGLVVAVLAYRSLAFDPRADFAAIRASFAAPAAAISARPPS